MQTQNEKWICQVGPFRIANFPENNHGYLQSRIWSREISLPLILHVIRRQKYHIKFMTSRIYQIWILLFIKISLKEITRGGKCWLVWLMPNVRSIYYDGHEYSKKYKKFVSVGENTVPEEACRTLTNFELSRRRVIKFSSPRKQQKTTCHADVAPLFWTVSNSILLYLFADNQGF